VLEVESHGFGFMPPALEKPVLLVEERWKLSCRGKRSGKSAIAIVLSDNTVDHQMAAMLHICSRYRSRGIMQASVNRILVFV